MMTKTRRIVGTRMRQLRKTAGFSQERLGRASDLSGKFIGEVERGEKSISLDSLTRISEALKVPLHDLARIDRDCRTTPTRSSSSSSRRSPAGIRRSWRSSSPLSASSSRERGVPARREMRDFDRPS